MLWTSNYFHINVRLCDSLLEIISYSGLTTNYQFSFDELRRQAEHIFTINAMLHSEPDKLNTFSFECSIPEELKASIGPTRFAFVNFVRLGDEMIAYTMVADMEPEFTDSLIHWTSKSFRPFDIRLIAHCLRRLCPRDEQRRGRAGFAENKLRACYWCLNYGVGRAQYVELISLFESSRSALPCRASPITLYVCKYFYRSLSK